ncbi:Gfo/Idh/MocA family protein [Methylocapsa acidiphila]|uniref:Gfo/Idh/MocA family protein n=1 Tax=Methylocapsa acidiphila TaxID=133552 RepID=UPI000428D7D5|nr:Gfo/Idh/MocA family oxidoreductase [Methylocapsa acidiphila]
MTTPDVLVIGAGEYVTGWTASGASRSDKRAGVALLSLLDLQRRGKIGKIRLCCRDGRRYPAIRTHIAESLSRYAGLRPSDIETSPGDDEVDEQSWESALEALRPGDAAIVAVPDHLHAQITIRAARLGIHAFVLKPLVQTLEENFAICDAARNVLVLTDMHKRLDPIYADARDRARRLGDFGYYASYMSQPRRQLETFSAWAGVHSDISYYLNAHHVDWHVWTMEGRGRPLRVTASKATGVGEALLGRSLEDTITLLVDWANIPSGAQGTAVYAASWVAPPSDVHSQQRFFGLWSDGEIRVDQAHRGYSVATLADGYSSPNPLFMRYSSSDGGFDGQESYGYRSIAEFIEAVARARACGSVEAIPSTLPPPERQLQTTAILEAGRRSLDLQSTVSIEYDAKDQFRPIGFGVLDRKRALDS